MPSGYTSLVAVKKTDLFQLDSLAGPVTLAGTSPAAGAMPECDPLTVPDAALKVHGCWWLQVILPYVVSGSY